MGLLVLTTACTQNTKWGDCIGAFDEPLPDRTYKVSTWNVAMAVIFFELIVPPIIVITNETKCPTGLKKIEPQPKD